VLRLKLVLQMRVVEALAAFDERITDRYVLFS
jgi:hypothetical protein